jgi:hypothetical protein
MSMHTSTPLTGVWLWALTVALTLRYQVRTVRSAHTCLPMCSPYVHPIQASKHSVEL